MAWRRGSTGDDEGWLSMPIRKAFLFLYLHIQYTETILSSFDVNRSRGRWVSSQLTCRPPASPTSTQHPSSVPPFVIRSSKQLVHSKTVAVVFLRTSLRRGLALRMNTVGSCNLIGLCNPKFSIP